MSSSSVSRRRRRRHQPNDHDRIQQAQGACCLFSLSVFQCGAFLLTSLIAAIAMFFAVDSVGYAWLCIWLLQGQLGVMYLCTFMLFNIYTVVATLIDCGILCLVEIVVASVFTSEYSDPCEGDGCAYGSVYQRSSIVIGLYLLGTLHFFQCIGLVGMTVILSRRMVGIKRREILVHSHEIDDTSLRRRRYRREHRSKPVRRQLKVDTAPSGSSSVSQELKSKPCASKQSQRSISTAKSSISTQNTSLITAPSTLNVAPMQSSNTTCPLSDNSKLFYSMNHSLHSHPTINSSFATMTTSTPVAEFPISRIIINVPPPFPSQPPQTVSTNTVNFPSTFKPIVAYYQVEQPKRRESDEIPTGTSGNSSTTDKSDHKAPPQKNSIKPLHNKNSLYALDSKIPTSPFDSTLNFDFDANSDNNSIILPSSIGHSPGTNVVAAQSIFTANKPRAK